MAGLMDMRELGMLRNATQRMESGGGIDMDEWRRRKREEEESAAEQLIALTQSDPRYQALMSGASGGPFAAGSVVRSLPFLRAGPAAVDAAKAVGRGASTAGKYLKNKLWSPGYPGAPKKGAMVFGKDASGKSVRRIASRPGEWKYSGRPTKAGALAGEAAVALGVGGGVLYNALQDDEPSTQETVEVTDVKLEESTKVKKEPDSKNLPNENKRETPSLWKTWGSLADNPKKRKKAYLSSIKNIYMKKMLLDSIAKLTGGKSQGDAWAQMAIAELDAIEKFDSEERTHNQWKALFFREDGTYDPPKNRKEAMERGQKLGYTSDQMKDILTVFPKSDSDKKGGVATEQYNIWKEMPEETEEERTLKEAYGNIINVNRGANRGKITAYQAASLLANTGLDLSDEQKAALTSIMDTGIQASPTTTNAGGKTGAPQAAIDMLMSNPSPDMQKAFKEKYGYLPEGL